MNEDQSYDGKHSTSKSIFYWAAIWLALVLSAFAFLKVGFYLGMVAERALKYEGPQADCHKELLYTKWQLEAARMVAQQLAEEN